MPTSNMAALESVRICVEQQAASVESAASDSSVQLSMLSLFDTDLDEKTIEMLRQGGDIGDW